MTLLLFTWDFINIKLNYINLYILTPFNSSIIYILKFSLALFFLIFIRAGLPRYRYDYLTKLGWIKFLLLMLAVILSFIFGLSIWN
uniref:NAD(P)H-quinone oxidoreductase subunit 1 n=1 Tax=Euplotes vanleeuwenhoeki TaxID=2794224 RepID=A0A7T1C4Z8_9SPIT|nr:NAD(P)H-quinone oxidoreductase subunit 1 [Euplotes vanleeuwenhoeki]QPM99262.1 NAD(P)H-quinone oxidoreductase subunit 1 [Euplotes vanleeuwenhoeki]